LYHIPKPLNTSGLLQGLPFFIQDTKAYRFLKLCFFFGSNNSAARLTFLYFEDKLIVALINSAARFSFVRFETSSVLASDNSALLASRRFQNKQRIHFL
jgi:hypothetical protein